MKKYCGKEMGDQQDMGALRNAGTCLKAEKTNGGKGRNEVERESNSAKR